jgi:hypothetical protein
VHAATRSTMRRQCIVQFLHLQEAATEADPIREAAE